MVDAWEGADAEYEYSEETLEQSGDFYFSDEVDDEL